MNFPQVRKQSQNFNRNPRCLVQIVEYPPFAGLSTPVVGTTYIRTKNFGEGCNLPSATNSYQDDHKHAKSTQAHTLQETSTFPFVV